MELARPISVAVACDPSLAGLFSILELKPSEGLKSSPDPGKTVLIVPDSDMAFNHWTTDFVFPLFCVFVLLLHLYSTTIVAPVSLYESPRRCMEIADAILTHAPIVQGPSYQTDQDQPLGSI